MDELCRIYSIFFFSSFSNTLHFTFYCAALQAGPKYCNGHMDWLKLKHAVLAVNLNEQRTCIVSMFWNRFHQNLLGMWQVTCSSKMDTKCPLFFIEHWIKAVAKCSCCKCNGVCFAPLLVRDCGVILRKSSQPSKAIQVDSQADGIKRQHVIWAKWYYSILTRSSEAITGFHNLSIIFHHSATLLPDTLFCYLEMNNEAEDGEDSKKTPNIAFLFYWLLHVKCFRCTVWYYSME